MIFGSWLHLIVIDKIGTSGTNIAFPEFSPASIYKLDLGYQSFKIGALLQEARLKRGLTQEELAKKCGTTRSYISHIENNIKEVRISTLQRIVETGFGGQLQLSNKNLRFGIQTISYYLSNFQYYHKQKDGQCIVITQKLKNENTYPG